MNMENSGLDFATFMNTAMRNAEVDGLGGNGLLWIFLLLLLGGNGAWGRGQYAGDVAVAEAVEKQVAKARAAGLSDELVTNAIKGNADAIAALSNRYDNGNNAVRETLNIISNGITKLSGDIGISTEKILNGIQMGNTVLGNQLQSCCCEVKQLVTNFGYENRIQNMQQTTELTGVMNAGFLTIGQKINDQTQQMNAGFQSIKDYLTGDKIATLQAEVNDLKNTNTVYGALTPIQNQLNCISSRIPPTPVPAYPVSNSYTGWYGSNSGCNCGG